VGDVIGGAECIAVRGVTAATEDDDNGDGEEEVGTELEIDSLFLANLSCLSSLAGERGNADSGAVSSSPICFIFKTDS
jgi:hypothetical protein